ncbi:MAG: hypothetical protein LBE09_01810 [Christensenellaceae bacterium]|jgi:glutamate--cysteine ligase|nr:hypothetical protein [Christensenellaceae bacterium]
MDSSSSASQSMRERNIDAIINYFERGCKRQQNGKLGIEIEHFIIDRNDGKSVDYYGSNGVESLLESLAETYSIKKYSRGHLIALSDGNKCEISLEPAAQLEVSLGMYSKIVEFKTEYSKFRKVIDPILEKHNYALITTGYRPNSRVDDLNLIPKLRYELMDKYFRGLGGYGPNMMRSTAATQVSIDYYCETDFKKKFRLANILTPLFAILMDGENVFEGEHGKTMVRTLVWDSVDTDRSGFACGALDNINFGFKDYAEYVYDRPSIMALDTSQEFKYTDSTPTNQVYGEVLMSDLDITHVLSMFFPYVRLKNFIEIRMADSMSIEYTLGFAALIKGLFYSQKNLTALLKIYEDIKTKDAIDAFDVLKEYGLDGTIYGKNVSTQLCEIISLASDGLTKGEKHYLKPLYKLATNTKRGALQVDDSKKQFEIGDKFKQYGYENCDR